MQRFQGRSFFFQIPWLVILGLASGGTVCALPAAASRRPAPTLKAPQPLPSIAAILRLDNEELKQEPPVSLRAVVTYLEPDSAHPDAAILYIQDGDAGIRAKLAAGRGTLHPGDLILVDGKAEMGRATPLVRATRIVVLGDPGLPQPLSLARESLLSGEGEGLRVRLQGRLQDDANIPNSFQLSLGDGAYRVPLAAARAGIFKPYHDQLVAITGVLTTAFDASRHAMGRELLIASAADIAPVRPQRAEQQDAPLVPIADLGLYAISRSYHGSVRIRGVITMRSSPADAFLQDDTGGLFLDNLPALPLLPGDEIEVSGIAAVSGVSPTLLIPLVHVLGHPGVPPPRPLSGFQAWQARYDANLITLTGRLMRLEISQSLSRQTLILESAGSFFSADLANSRGSLTAKHLRLGSIISVTGVCSQDGTPINVSSLRVNLRSPADVRVISASPIWRSWHWLTVLSSLLAIGLIALVWILLLRRQLRRQTRLILERAAEKRRLQERLRHAQKLEAIGRLAGGVAHDFNNLLTIISGRAELLLLKAEPDSAMRHGLEEIHRAADRAATVTRQLLAYSRQQVLQTRAIDLNLVLANMREMLKALLGETIRVRILTQPDLDAVSADQDQIERVLMNLVVNARDAMAEGGDLLIATHNVHWGSETPAPQELFFGQQDDLDGYYVCLTVEDNGCGIPADVCEHIFDPFFTTKPLGQGTGLGLSTVFGIVQQSAGFIGLLSQPGLGTRFRVFLPAVAAEEPSATTESAAQRSLP